MYTDRFILYKKAVVDVYLHKRMDAQMRWLIKPTRSRIKKWCCELAEVGVNKDDEKTLRDYMGLSPVNADFLEVLRKRDEQDFRGFQDFLNRTETRTSVENVELLAWLIDFPTRPYAQFIKELQNEPALKREKEVLIPPVQQDGTREPDASGQGQETPVLKREEVIEGPGPEGGKRDVVPEGGGKGNTVIKYGHKKKEWFFIGIGVLLIGGVILWWVWPDGRKCMYWSDDRYVKAYCDIPRIDTPLLPVDIAKLRGFRKIKKTDTLTPSYALKHFWYTRVADSLEVYTASGTHPLNPDKPLEPVTDYVVNFCKNHSKYGKP